MIMDTSLPPPEEILEERERNTMTLRRICVTDMPSTVVQTTLFRKVAGDQEPRPLFAMLYTIDDDLVRGYIPTKSLLYSGVLEMVFFVSPSLPAQVRPFGDGKTHVLMFSVDVTTEVSYDIEKRILLDQQVDASMGEVYYIVVFGDKQYDDIVITPDYGDDVAVTAGE